MNVFVCNDCLPKEGETHHKTLAKIPGNSYNSGWVKILVPGKRRILGLDEVVIQRVMDVKSWFEKALLPIWSFLMHTKFNFLMVIANDDHSWCNVYFDGHVRHKNPPYFIEEIRKNVKFSFPWWAKFP